MIQLETYKGTKSRHTCPACSYKNVFARYLNTDTGEYLSETCGRCNRESKCGYHFTPKMFYEQNPLEAADFKTQKRRTAETISKPAKSSAVRLYYKNPAVQLPDYIDFNILLRTLTNYESNPFVCFLLDLFPDCRDIVFDVIKKYFVGSTKTGKTVFWQIDEAKRIRTGKIILYDARSGKRIKSYAPGWVHAELKKQKLLSENFNLGQCFFGEHLLVNETEKPVAVVESEKTAVIASICFPEFVWLAIGSKQSLKPEKLRRFGNRKIILYPDADGFARWHEIAAKSRELGLTVNVSELIENHATSEQKESGHDLADYLINQQTKIIEFNRAADRYNAKLEKVFNSQMLAETFDEMFDERRAFMEADDLPDTEVRRIVERLTDEQLAGKGLECSDGDSCGENRGSFLSESK